MTIAEITEAIAALDLDEARALLDALRERLAIEGSYDDEAWRWGNVAVMYGPPPFWTPRVDQFVVLDACGAERLKVLSALRTHVGLSVLDARAALDRLPLEFGPFDDPGRAADIVSALRKAGAVVHLRDAT